VNTLKLFEACRYALDMLDQPVPTAAGGVEPLGDRLGAMGGYRATVLLREALAAPGVLPWWERVPAELVEDYAALVRDTRQCQQLYKRTLDGTTRREAERLEAEVDRVTAAIGEALAASVVPVPLMVKGGAA
jgi:hypothetical protein